MAVGYSNLIQRKLVQRRKVNQEIKVGVTFIHMIIKTTRNT